MKLQFSLRRLLVSTALIALGIALFSVPSAMGCNVARKGGPPLSELTQWLLTFGGAAVFGIGLGNIFHRPIFGAVVAMLLLLILMLPCSHWLFEAN